MEGRFVQPLPMLNKGTLICTFSSIPILHPWKAAHVLEGAANVRSYGITCTNLTTLLHEQNYKICSLHLRPPFCFFCKKVWSSWLTAWIGRWKADRQSADTVSIHLYNQCSQGLTKSRFTHSMPFPCRAHAVPLPCRASKGLECVFHIWFTQCGRVWFTLAMSCPCHAPTMPFFSRPQHSTAVSRRPYCGLEKNGMVGAMTWQV